METKYISTTTTKKVFILFKSIGRGALSHLTNCFHKQTICHSEAVGSPALEALIARLDGVLRNLSWWMATLPWWRVGVR